MLAAVHLVDQEREELRADKWGTFAVFETKISSKWHGKCGCKVVFWPLKCNNNLKECPTNQDKKDQLPVTISSRQIMQTVSVFAKSSAVASGYNVFKLRMARLERITSLNAFLKDLN